MPKRVGFLYEKMTDKGFIRSCILKASRHKMKRRAVRRVIEDIDRYVDMTYEMMRDGTFIPTQPKTKTIYDTSSQKERTIQTVPFWPDAVVHWMAVEAAKPVFMRGMYYYSCASIPGRGAARAYRRIKSALRRDERGTRYAAEMDIRRYYPSLSVDRIMAAMGRKIKDRRYLALVEGILRSGGSGLSIGFYINQWVANLYLEPLDHYIKSMDGVKYMTRYMDNIVLMGPNKKKLHRARRAAARFMDKRLGVCMKSDWQVFPTAKRAVSAVGYRFGRGYTILRKRTFLLLSRQIRRIGKRQSGGMTVSARQARSMLSRMGQARHYDSLKVKEMYRESVDSRMVRAAAGAA